MREFKFRFWDNSSKKMYDNGYTPEIFGSLHLFEESTIIMQYTGLKDKNGKEIYEGDILSTSCSSGPFDLRYSIEIVKFHEFCRINCHKKEISEIIGNIYENPELLEKVDDK